mgnify:CR=1 FL=1
MAARTCKHIHPDKSGPLHPHPALGTVCPSYQAQTEGQNPNFLEGVLQHWQKRRCYKGQVVLAVTTAVSIQFCNTGSLPRSQS